MSRITEWLCWMLCQKVSSTGALFMEKKGRNKTFYIIFKGVHPKAPGPSIDLICFYCFYCNHSVNTHTSEERKSGDLLLAHWNIVERKKKSEISFFLLATHREGGAWSEWQKKLFLRQSYWWVTLRQDDSRWIYSTTEIVLSQIFNNIHERWTLIKFECLLRIAGISWDVN